MEFLSKYSKPILVNLKNQACSCHDATILLILSLGIVIYVIESSPSEEKMEHFYKSYDQNFHLLNKTFISRKFWSMSVFHELKFNTDPFRKRYFTHHNICKRNVICKNRQRTEHTNSIWLFLSSTILAFFSMVKK